MISYAIEVVTDGPANRDNDLHRRAGGYTRSGELGGATEQKPACGTALAAGSWRSYGYGRALEMGAALCMEKACFGAVFGGAE